MGYVLSAGYAEVYEAFLDYRRQRSTALGYEQFKRITLHILKWFEQEEIPLDAVTVPQAIAFRTYESERVKTDGNPIADSTLTGILNAARALFEFIAETGRSSSNPFEEVENPRRSWHLSSNYLTEAQLGRLLGELGRFDKAATKAECRHRYLLHVIGEFMYATGLRGTETAYVEERDVDLKQLLVYVRDGKGDKSRMAFLTRYAADILAMYLEQMRTVTMDIHAKKYRHCLFGFQRESLIVFVNNGLKAYCTALQLPVVSSHAFRHSLGTHLLHAGCDMRHIQAILGHERLRTTQIYTRVSTDEVKKIIDQFHPRASFIRRPDNE
jgi:site-specific recombinase XerD